jgi:hypothetical protein
MKREQSLEIPSGASPLLIAVGDDHDDDSSLLATSDGLYHVKEGELRLLFWAGAEWTAVTLSNGRFVACSHTDARLWTLTTQDNESTLAGELPQAVVLAEDVGRVLVAALNQTGGKLALSLERKTWILRLEFDDRNVLTQVHHEATLGTGGGAGGMVNCHWLKCDLLVTVARTSMGQPVNAWNVDGERTECAGAGPAASQPIFPPSFAHHAITASAELSGKSDGKAMLALGNANGDVYLLEVLRRGRGEKQQVEILQANYVNVGNAARVAMAKHDASIVEHESRSTVFVAARPRNATRRMSSHAAVAVESGKPDPAGGAVVEVSQDILALEFFVRSTASLGDNDDDEGAGDSVVGPPSWLLVVATRQALALVDVRACELLSILPFSHQDTRVIQAYPVKHQ